MTLFLQLNEDLITIAVIPYMPQTTLTRTEYARIEDLMILFLEGDSIWNTFKSGNLFQLDSTARN